MATTIRDGFDPGEWSITGGSALTGVVSTGGVVVADTVAEIDEPAAVTAITRYVHVLMGGRLESE